MIDHGMRAVMRTGASRSAAPEAVMVRDEPVRGAARRLTVRGLRFLVMGTAGGLGVPDILAAAALTAVVIAVGAGLLHTSGPHVDAGAAAGAVAMTAPVAWRRPAPLAVAAVLAAAALLNGLVFGPLVRCGVALPALFLVAFAVGARCERKPSATGLTLCVAALIAEGLYDPHIGLPGLTFIVPVLVAFFAAGRLVRARNETAATLRLSSVKLRRQREQTARLAVIADRAQISTDLERTLHARIDGIADAAAAGLDVLDADHGAARQVMVSIEQDGRQALQHMREILGTLRDRAPREPDQLAGPAEPQPTLALLPQLLARTTTAAARLTIDGSQRTLPAGLELSGYRIIEHLLQALDDSPEAAVEVRLRFCPDALELYVSGPPSAGADLRAVLAAATERASLHSGVVRQWLDGRTCHAMARLPLISGHA